MKFVDNARKFYRMFSIQALAFIGFVQSVLLVLPAEKSHALIPFTSASTWYDLGVALTIIAAVLGGFGRLIDQGQVTQAP